MANKQGPPLVYQACQCPARQSTHSFLRITAKEETALTQNIKVMCEKLSVQTVK